MTLITLQHVQEAVNLTDFDAQTAHMRMSPIPRGQRWAEEPRKAAVLVLVYPHAEERLHLILTKRTETLQKHSGQVSFPGGKRDEGDYDYVATALRETCEELGICEELTILGQLSQVYIPPSNFDVFPSVAYTPVLPTLRPNPFEVSDVLSLALDDLLNPTVKGTETRHIQGFDVRTPYYRVEGHKVWGATAVMLSEFEERLRCVVGVF